MSKELIKKFCVNRETRLAFTGSGGKTTAMFLLARQFKGSVIITATTHLACEQCHWADFHHTVSCPEDLNSIHFSKLHGVHLFTGEVEKVSGSNLSHNIQCRNKGLEPPVIDVLKIKADQARIPMFIEADGSRQKALKAPADQEPIIPRWVDKVVYVVGLEGLGKPLTKGNVHRPEIFAQLADLKYGDTITLESLSKVVISKDGGRKGIPPKAQKILLLNQADEQIRQSKAFRLAVIAIPFFDKVIISSLHRKNSNTYAFEKPHDKDIFIHSLMEPIAGVILAAGQAKRYGSPKVLLPFRGKPFIRQIAETALSAGLDPVIIVAGAEADRIAETVEDLPVKLIINHRWRYGQGTSVAEGVKNLPDTTGGAIFFLGDQPQVTPMIIDTLVSIRRSTGKPIIAPIVNKKRANPVFFDNTCFPKMAELDGDIGGRAIFDLFPVHELIWLDNSVLQDVDTKSDYQNILEME